MDGGFLPLSTFTLALHVSALFFINLKACMYNVCMLNRKDELISERLTLKSIEEDSKKELLEIVKDPLVKKSYMLPDFESEKEEENFFQKLRNFTLDKSKFVYGIYSKNKIIGFINQVCLENDVIELGYFIASKEWNKGYATEALKMAINELFRMGIKTVQAGHFENNPASGRVMQKAGMHKIEKTEVIVYRNEEHQCVFYEISR